jgi:hypothetical protein
VIRISKLFRLSLEDKKLKILEEAKQLSSVSLLRYAFEERSMHIFGVASHLVHSKIFWLIN